MTGKSIHIKRGLSFLERLQEGGFKVKSSYFHPSWRIPEIVQDGFWEWKLFQFGSDMFISYEDAVKNIQQEQWGVARVEHLFAAGKLYPRGSEGATIIIALGTVCQVQREPGASNIPSVYGAYIEKGRKNELSLLETSRFAPQSFFLAVRPVNIEESVS